MPVHLLGVRDVYRYLNLRLVTKYPTFFIIRPTRCIKFSILFWNETLHVSDSSSFHHQEYFTVHTAVVYVIPFCGPFASGIRMELRSILILIVLLGVYCCLA
jgi:hypothetical protein